MRRHLLVGIGVVVVLAITGTILMVRPWQPAHQSLSPYVDQQASPVRGLSAQEVDDLLNGRGAGYARAAELNNYPGPLHVLDLKQQLGLSPDQAARIEGVFHQMQAEARRLGHEIVQREADLSAAFASGTISEAELQAQTAALADRYGELRAVHLRAHLQTTPLLSADQIARYNALRGYPSTTRPAAPDAHDRRHP